MERQLILKEIHDLADRIKSNHSGVDSLMADVAQLYEMVVLLKHFPEEVKKAEQWQTPVEIKQSLAQEAVTVSTPEAIKTEKTQTSQATIDLFSAETGPARVQVESAAPSPAPAAKKEVPEKSARKKTEESVAEKLQHKKIADLKAAIGINEKFQFINELFDGNMKEYTVAIDQINNFTSMAEAESYLANLEDVYKWQSDSHIAENFKELVERRFA